MNSGMYESLKLEMEYKSKSKVRGVTKFSARKFLSGCVHFSQNANLILSRGGNVILSGVEG